MANNYPHKIVRTGDRVELMNNEFHTILFIVSKGKRTFETVVENMDGVVVELDGISKTIGRERIRKIHTVEHKKCQKKTKAKMPA